MGVVKAAVLTVSDGVFHGTREDRSGAVLEELLTAEGYEVERRVVPDERDEIVGRHPGAGRRRAARADDGRNRCRAPGRHA